jgi:hypothetical protein
MDKKTKENKIKSAPKKKIVRVRVGSSRCFTSGSN